MNKFIVLGLLIVSLGLFGCAGTQEKATPAEEGPAEEAPAEAAPPLDEEVDSREPTDQEEPTEEIAPEVIEEPPAEELTSPEEPAEEQKEDEEAVEQGAVEEYVPSQETYDRTFSEVEETIGRLNEIIRDRDFEEWKSYLTENYLRRMSSPEMLEELSSRRILERNNIVLESLEDYFRFVVVPSRANARLDDLVFRNDEQVEAIMIIQGQRVILYQLRKVNGTWKIAIF